MDESTVRPGGSGAGGTDRDGLRAAFAVADELAVHGSDCVCPRCAGRLLDLLRRLAAALDVEPVPHV